jgi:ABC-2 type transport system ATP-binding protein
MSGSDPHAPIAARGIVKRYGDLTAVDGIDITVERGACLGLLGPNGAGKTTSIEMLEGLLVPDAGEIRVLGMAWDGNGDAIRQRIGVQLQETRLPDKLTVTEILTLFRSFYDDGHEWWG